MGEVTDCLSQIEWLSDFEVFEASTMHSQNQGRKLTHNFFLLKAFTRKSQHFPSLQ